MINPDTLVKICALMPISEDLLNPSPYVPPVYTRRQRATRAIKRNIWYARLWAAIKLAGYDFQEEW